MTTLIQSDQELAAFCEALRQSRFVTLDTEFIRDRTYWPRLCLVQAAGEKDIAAFDPLAGLNLAPFFELLKDPAVTKVFHAARQDIEIFYHMSGAVPAPIADTQVMASVCGHGEAASYESLVSRLTGGRIDKSSRFTDWAQRPLSDKQLSYAIDDVRYLRPVYEKLLAEVEQRGRSGWIAEDMAVLENPDTYQLHPENAWKRLKMRIGKPKQYMLLRELAAWREMEAQKSDVPRSRILRDEALAEIIYHPPQSLEDLTKLRGLYADVARGRIGAGILEAVKAALSRPPEPLPEDLKRKPGMAGTGAICDMLKVLLRFISEEEKVAPRIIASSAELDELAEKDDADIPALHGWRFELFGKRALELKHGHLAMKLEDGKIRFCEDMTLKKTLLLMRHGEAKDAAPGGSDFERVLSPRGDAVVRAQAATMMDKNLWPDVVLVSSATRTRQTADLLRMSWEGDMEPMIENRTDIYHATADAIIHMIRAQDPNYSTTMVIGHNPVIHQLSLLLLKTGELDKFPSLKNTFQPATCTVLSLSMRSWAELGPQTAELADLLTPPQS